MSDRLDGERLKAVREMLSKTITDEKTEKDAAAAKVKAEQAQVVEAERKGRPPLTASETLFARLEANEIDEQRMKAMRSSIETLRTPLQAERDSLAREREVLEKDKAAFQAIVAAANTRAKDEQFKKTVSVIDSLKAADARQVLSEIMKGADATATAQRAADPSSGALKANTGAEAIPSPPPPTGPTPSGLARALDYLNAMQPRTRSKVVTEFAKDDPKLAGELLERLRTYGQVPLGTENLSRAGSN
jgi:hypothetical protein